jgi:hypothetical protein
MAGPAPRQGSPQAPTETPMVSALPLNHALASCRRTTRMERSLSLHPSTKAYRRPRLLAGLGAFPPTGTEPWRTVMAGPTPHRKT